MTDKEKLVGDIKDAIIVLYTIRNKNIFFNEEKRRWSTNQVMV